MRGRVSTLLAYDRNDSTNRRLKEAAVKWLNADIPKVSVTLIAQQFAFHEGSIDILTDEKLSHAVSIFMERLSRLYMPARAVNHLKARLHHAFVWEYGERRGLHEHGWIELPPEENEETFMSAIDETWRRMRFGDYAYVKPSCDEGWMRYSLKNKTTGLPLEHIDVRNVHLP